MISEDARARIRYSSPSTGRSARSLPSPAGTARMAPARSMPPGSAPAASVTSRVSSTRTAISSGLRSSGTHGCARPGCTKCSGAEAMGGVFHTAITFGWSALPIREASFLSTLAGEEAQVD